MTTYTPTRNLRATLQALTRQIEDTLDAGQLAALRRADSAPNLALMALLVRTVDQPGRWPLPSEDGARAAAESVWSTVISGLVRTRGLRDATPSGAALAAADLSELRLNRLLRAQGATLRGEVRAASQLLASKAVGSDWTDLAQLLLYPDGDDAERHRLKLARDYFRAIHRAEQASAAP